MLLYRVIIIIIMLFSNIDIVNMDSDNLFNIMSTASEVVIYQDNKKLSFTEKSSELNNILYELSVNSRECPAFGVSLHNETSDAMKNGLWIEFQFNKTITHNDLPFNSLLINIVGDYTGFNIIRKYNGKYEGRCFYIDLVDSNLSKLESYLKSL